MKERKAIIRWCYRMSETSLCDEAEKIRSAWFEDIDIVGNSDPTPALPCMGGEHLRVEPSTLREHRMSRFFRREEFARKRSENRESTQSMIWVNSIDDLSRRNWQNELTRPRRIVKRCKENTGIGGAWFKVPGGVDRLYSLGRKFEAPLLYSASVHSDGTGDS